LCNARNQLAQSSRLSEAAQNSGCGLVDAAMHRRKRNHKMTHPLNNVSVLDHWLESQGLGRDNHLWKLICWFIGPAQASPTEALSYLEFFRKHGPWS
jgi:hypothetical protein